MEHEVSGEIIVQIFNCIRLYLVLRRKMHSNRCGNFELLASNAEYCNRSGLSFETQTTRFLDHFAHICSIVHLLDAFELVERQLFSVYFYFDAQNMMHPTLVGLGTLFTSIVIDGMSNIQYETSKESQQ